MPVPTQVSDLSTTIASNAPAGSDNVFPDLDNHIRALAGMLASVATNSATNGYSNPYLPNASAAVFNESGADIDFRAEGDTDANLLFLDASTDRVGVGTNTPDAKLTVNGVGAFGDGAVGAPSIANTGDLNTGIWFPAADTVAVSTGGVEAARLDSSGNLGLGVAPSAWQSIYKAIQFGPTGALFSTNVNTFLGDNVFINSAGTATYISSSFSSVYKQNSGQHQWFTAPSGTAGNAITFTQAMTLDASGNLQVGTTSGTFINGKGIVIADATAARLKLADTDAGVGTSNGLELGFGGAIGSIYNLENGALLFGTNNTERARITSGGDLLVAKTNNTVSNVGHVALSDGSYYSTMAASANTTTTLNVYSTGAAAYRFYVGLGGTIYATSTTITAISDQRLKENIRDLDAGLSEVMALKPRKFDWKAGKGKDKKNDRGWIAQEFEQVFPDMVDTWADPAPEGEAPYKAVNADLIPVLVKAIQEQQALITDLRARVAALEAL